VSGGMGGREKTGHKSPKHGFKERFWQGGRGRAVRKRTPTGDLDCVPNPGLAARRKGMHIPSREGRIDTLATETIFNVKLTLG